jgi:hypothetical protein
MRDAEVGVCESLRALSKRVKLRVGLARIRHGIEDVYSQLCQSP